MTGDRVRVDGVPHVVIGISGTGVRLADEAGEVIEATVTGLLAEGRLDLDGAEGGRPSVPRREAGLESLPEAMVRRRGYRRVIDGAGLSYRIITLPSGGDGRPPGDPIRGLARLAGQLRTRSSPCPRPPAAAAGDEPPHAGAESTGDITRHRCERDGVCRTQIGLGEPGVGHGLLLRDRLGGIWEVASGANRLEPVPTELKRSPLIWPFSRNPWPEALIGTHGKEKVYGSIP